MKIDTRNPRIHVRFISLEHGEISADVVRPSIISVTIHRRMGGAAGAFQISLQPRKIGGLLSPLLPTEWRDILGQMDYVEIAIDVAPRPPTVVMRGFIDTISHEGSIENNIPSQSVVVSGRDFGKLLILTKPYYIDGIQQVEIFNRWKQGFLNIAWQSGTLPDPEHNPLAPNVNTDAPLYAPRDLLKNLFETFYEPQQELILSRLPTVIPMRFFPVENALINTNERELATIAPDILSLNWAPFTDIWTLMRLYQHSPWRELYVIDEAEGPLLVYRPNPWITFNGTFVYQGMETGHMGTMLTHQILEKQIVKWSLSRSEEYVRNFFFTYTDEFGALAQFAKTTGVIEGLYDDALYGNPYLVGHQATDRAEAMRSDYSTMGFRLSEVRTPYLDFDHRTSKGQIEVRLREIKQQGKDENLRLTRAYDHTGVLEFGAIQVQGDERIQIGHYIQMGDLLPSTSMFTFGARYYVEGVTHFFQQEGNGVFLTNLEVSRGRGHMVRKGLVTQ